MRTGFVLGMVLLVSGCSNTVYHQPHYYQSTVQPELQAGKIYSVRTLRSQVPKTHSQSSQANELKNTPGKFALQYPKPSYFE